MYKIPKPKKYNIQNKDKYKGNTENIWSRSSWELRIMKWFDDNNSIIWWSSEEIKIPYISPIDNKVHNYHPDFIFQVKDKTGKLSIHMWEIKPYKQLSAPIKRKNTKLFIEETATFEINKAKWNAAKMFCLEYGWKFSIITEKDMGI